MKFKLNGFYAHVDETAKGWRITIWDRWHTLISVSAPQTEYPDAYILARRLLARTAGVPL